MNYTNFSIKAKNGTFYTTSKEPREGYVKNTYQDKETKETKINYHKEVNTIKGKLYSMGIQETPFGKVFKISLNPEENEAHVLDVNVFQGKRGINDHLKAFCQYIEKVKANVGEEIEISLNRKAKDKNGYLYKNVYVKIDGEKTNWAFSSFGEDSPVPKGKQVPDKITGELSWDFSENNKFYWDKLVENSIVPDRSTDNEEKPKAEPSEPKKENTASPTKKSKAKKEVVEEEEDDDLPF